MSLILDALRRAKRPPDHSPPAHTSTRSVAVLSSLGYAPTQSRRSSALGRVRGTAKTGSRLMVLIAAAAVMIAAWQGMQWYAARGGAAPVNVRRPNAIVPAPLRPQPLDSPSIPSPSTAARSEPVEGLAVPGAGPSEARADPRIRPSTGSGQTPSTSSPSAAALPVTPDVRLKPDAPPRESQPPVTREARLKPDTTREDEVASKPGATATASRAVPQPTPRAAQTKPRTSTAPARSTPKGAPPPARSDLLVARSTRRTPPAEMPLPPPPSGTRGVMGGDFRRGAASDADHFKLALYFHRAGDFENALVHYKALLQQNELNAEAHNNLGVLYQEKGLLEEAVKEFQRATFIDPTYTKAHNNLGVAFLRSGKVDAAAGEFRLVLGHEPKNVEALVNLALALKAGGHAEPARETLLKALAIDTGCAPCHYNLALLDEDAGDFLKAIEHYQAFLQHGSVQHGDLVADVRARIDALSARVR